VKTTKKIDQIEFEQIVTTMENKPYLVIVAGVRGSANLQKTDNVKQLTEFNQTEMLKEVSTIFILKDWTKFNNSLKGFMYPFTIVSIDDLNPNLYERNRIYEIV
jgi:hypothetical protein